MNISKYLNKCELNREYIASCIWECKHNLIQTLERIFFFFVFVPGRKWTAGGVGKRGNTRRASRSISSSSYTSSSSDSSSSSSGSGSRSRSRSRSRGRAGKAKKYRSRRREPSLYWDIPPEGFQHFTPLQYKEMHAAGEIASNIADKRKACLPAVSSAITRHARR